MTSAMRKKWVSIMTILVMVFTLVTPTFGNPKEVSAATPTDIQDHWAYTYILRGIQLGFINGYPDGTFLPDNPVSRAEFAKMVNAALGNTGTASTTFSDVPGFEWFYQDVSKAVAATYVAGYDDGTFLPNKAISRQEAAVMIARIVPSYGTTSNLSVYSDGNRVADWAAEYVRKVVGKGYLGAYDDGLLHPEDSLTRAQTAKIICSILDKETIVKNFTTIKDDETVKKNTLYANTVTLSKDLSEGEVDFSNCTLLGGLVVSGGGSNTVTIENSRVSFVTVNKDDTMVRVLAKGATTIPQTTSHEKALLETKSLAGGAFGAGFASVDVRGGSDTTFTGYFPLVYLVGSKAVARLDGCSFERLVVSSGAKNSEVYVDSRSLINVADVNAIASFHDTGTIKQMNANVSGITYEVKPDKWTLASGVTAPTVENPDVRATFAPANGNTNIALTVKPTISFLTEIETYAGDAITATYLKNNLVFRKGSASGSDVTFTAALSSNKRVITVTPSANLESNQSYYLGFATNKFRAVSSEETIPAKSVVFTTVNTTPTVSFNPANGAVQVPTTAALKVTFSDTIYNTSGTTPNSQYLTDNIQVVKVSGGSSITSGASISGNVVTIPAPTTGWENGVSYRITVMGSAFKNAAGVYVPQSSVTFITGTQAPVLTISGSTPSFDRVVVTAGSSISGTAYFVATTNGAIPSVAQIKAGQDATGSPVSRTSGTITGESSFTLGSLVPNTSYTIYGVVSANGKDSSVVFDSTTTPWPDAVLSTWSYEYTTSGSSIEPVTGTLILSSSSLTLGVPGDVDSISFTATAPSGTLMTFGGGAIGSGEDSTTANVSLAGTPPGSSVAITLTVSGASLTSKTYNLVLTKNSL